ncbi:MAG TPA: PQQ-binding-like beta-propeller repeat protein [Bryobacteraceae bacterium]|nr:PQQ-binding-like beta-propeller repeat protein [Bryobacteraceae bacterium]
MRAACILVSLFIPCAWTAPSGEEVYQKRCSGCHGQVNERVPPREALQKMPAARILRALDSGAMMAIAFTLHRDDRIAVANYLGTKETIPGPAASAFCSDRTVKLSSNPAGWDGWSPGKANARFQSSELAGLSVDGVRNLKLKWAFGFNGDVTAFAPPTVLDGHLFVGSAGGVVHAMRAETGCLEWTYQANGPVRSSIQVVRLEGGRVHALLFGDMTGWFYAITAESGKLLWKVHVEEHDSTRLTGAPAAHNGVVYVPVASWEETRATNPDYSCCTFRGSVIALRIADGKQLWKTYMVDPPQQTGKNARGIPTMGPSGVGVWSAPTVDQKRGVLYVTTGDNYSGPATELSDGVVALDLATGRVIWSKQITAGDIFSGACLADKSCGPDFDFGSPAIVVTPPGGRDLLLAGQKSGIVYALDPEKKGEVVWQTRVGKGSTNGGVQWGMSTDGQFVYAAVSDPGRARQNDVLDPRRYKLDPAQGGGLTALRVADGSKVWYAAPTPCPAGAPSGCSPSQPAAVTGIPGVVFSGAVDGHMRAFSSEDGKVLWDFDTVRDFSTVNSVKAHGGSIDGPGAVVVKGMVFINSGYPRNGGMPGNVLLAFGPE